jgi:hypothetical protein
MFKQFFICAALVAALVAPSNAQPSPPASEQTKQIEALCCSPRTTGHGHGASVSCDELTG